MFSAAPLVEAVERIGPPAVIIGHNSLRRAFVRAKTAGSLTPHMADTLAVKVLHVHPSAIWPDWYDVEL